MTNRNTATARNDPKSHVYLGLTNYLHTNKGSSVYKQCHLYLGLTNDLQIFTLKQSTNKARWVVVGGITVTENLQYFGTLAVSVLVLTIMHSLVYQLN